MEHNKNENLSILESFFRVLPSLVNYHAPASDIYTFLKMVAREQAEDLFSEEEAKSRPLAPFGTLVFPYHKMGETVDSINLFDLDELIIFSFYWVNRNRYKKVLDLGANLGLHSIIMDKCGFNVRSYEPDPWHFEILQSNLGLNHCKNVQPYNAGISSKSGTMDFIRIKGNTTSSHLAGSKSSLYGETELFPVKVESIQSQIGWADLIKMDVEGHEKEVLLATNRDHWKNADALVEIQNDENAAAIYQHFSAIGVNLFSQKINWIKVNGIEDMPTSYHDGTLFITCKGSMAWKEN